MKRPSRDLIRLLTLEMRDEADAAGIVLVSRIVESPARQPWPPPRTSVTMIVLGFVSAIGVVIDLSPSSALDSVDIDRITSSPTSGAGGGRAAAIAPNP